jgi:hypothetical protein
MITLWISQEVVCTEDSIPFAMDLLPPCAHRRTVTHTGHLERSQYPPNPALFQMCAMPRPDLTSRPIDVEISPDTN